MSSQIRNVNDLFISRTPRLIYAISGALDFKTGAIYPRQIAGLSSSYLFRKPLCSWREGDRRNDLGSCCQEMSDVWPGADAAAKRWSCIALQREAVESPGKSSARVEGQRRIQMKNIPSISLFAQINVAINDLFSFFLVLQRFWLCPVKLSAYVCKHMHILHMSSVWVHM